VNAALRLARTYGVSVSFADLGDWGTAELRSEYDPSGPAIRINARVARKLSGRALREFVALAVAHELYHHREHIGEIARTEPARRESEADRYARDVLAAAR
jgi:hypothetical protein